MKDNYICPHCRTEQDHVLEDRLHNDIYKVYPNGSQLQYQHEEVGEDSSSMYFCPECDTQLAKSEEEVERIFDAQYYYVCKDEMTDHGLKTTHLIAFLYKYIALEYMNNLDLRERDVNVDENLRVLSSKEYIDVLSVEYKVDEIDDNVYLGRSENLRAFLDRISNL